MAKKALGRGLNAIFEDVEESYNRELESSHDYHDIVKELDVELIHPNPYQPRTHFDDEALKELSLSIQRHGLLQPIIVVKKDGEYMLIAGERRLRATKLANIESIKAIVADFESQNLRELALIENIQREDLNPIELANSYKELISEHKITQEELSKIIHKSRAQITNTMRLLQLNPKTQQLISEGKISQGHAKIVVGLDKKDEETIIDTILGQKLSVREAENLVKKIKQSELGEKKAPISNTKLDMNSIKVALKKLGIRVKVGNNSITLGFDNNEQVVNFTKKITK